MGPKKINTFQFIGLEKLPIFIHYRLQLINVITKFNYDQCGLSVQNIIPRYFEIFI